MMHAALFFLSFRRFRSFPRYLLVVFFLFLSSRLSISGSGISRSSLLHLLFCCFSLSDGAPQYALNISVYD